MDKQPIQEDKKGIRTAVGVVLDRSGSMGIHSSKCLNYTADAGGTRSAFRSLSASTANYSKGLSNDINE